MRRLLAMLVLCCAFLGAAQVASAAETWHVTVRGNGHVYDHTYEIELDPETGDFTGTGYIDDDPENWPETVWGNLTGSTLTFTSLYGEGGHTGYTYSFTATVAADGTFVGDSIYGQGSIQGWMPPRVCHRHQIDMRLAADGTFYPHTYNIEVDPETGAFTGTGFVHDDPNNWPEEVSGTYDGTRLSLTSLYGPGGNPMYVYSWDAVVASDGSFVGDSRYGVGTATGTIVSDCRAPREPREPREPELIRQRWNVVQHHLAYSYEHVYDVEIDPATGAFTGTGYLIQQPQNQPEVVSGTLDGTTLTLNSVYEGGSQPGFTFGFTATVRPDGTIDGSSGWGPVTGSGVQLLD